MEGNAKKTAGLSWGALGAISVPWAVYITFICPTIYWRDSSELVTTGYTLGISHPMGSPTYSLLAKLFTFVPVGSVAFRINLASAVGGSLAIYLVYKIILEIGGRNRDPAPPGGLLPAIAFIFAMILALSRAFWSYSIVAEVYTQHAMWLSLLILLLIRSQRCREEGRRNRYLLTFFFLLGLSSGTYAFMILYLPAAVGFLAFQGGGIRWDLGRVSLVIFFLLLGLSVYMYLPLRSSTAPILDWGNTSTFDGLLYHITDRKDVSYHFTLEGKRLPFQFKNYLSLLPWQVTWPGLVLAPIGSLVLFFRNRRLWLFLTLVFSIHLMFFVRTWVEDFGFMPTFMILILWGGMGMAFLIESLFRSASGAVKVCSPQLWSALLLASMMLGILSMARANLTHADKWDYHSTDRYGKNLFSSVEENGVLFVMHGWFESLYLRGIENFRPDADVIFRNAFYNPGRFVDEGPSAHPRLKYPENADRMTPLQIMAQIARLSLPDRPVFWDPEEDQEKIMDHLIPQGLIFSVRDSGVGPISDDEISRHYAHLNRILARELEEESFLRDEEGLLKYAIYLSNMGEFFHQKGMQKDTFVMHNLAISINPKFYNSLVIAGVMNAQRGHEEEAEKLLLSAISVEPYRFEARNNLSALYLNQGRIEEAMDEAKTALLHNPRNPMALYNLGICHERLGEREPFIRQMRRVVEADPDGEMGKKALEKLRAITEGDAPKDGT